MSTDYGRILRLADDIRLNGGEAAIPFARAAGFTEEEIQAAIYEVVELGLYEQSLAAEDDALRAYREAVLNREEMGPPLRDDLWERR